MRGFTGGREAMLGRRVEYGPIEEVLTIPSGRCASALEAIFLGRNYDPCS